MGQQDMLARLLRGNPDPGLPGYPVMQSAEDRGFAPMPRSFGDAGQRLAAVLRGDVEPTPEEGRQIATVRGFTEGPASIRAFHGSPHRFDRFDMSRIGTGEGAQAYGHGLYFAGNEDVARSYRDTLSQPSNLEMLDYFNKHGRFPPETGSMYEVNLNTTPDRLLDWDAPISQQSPEIQPVLRQMLESAKKSFSGIDASGNPIAGQVHHLYQQHVGGHSDFVAEKLREAGIPGIQYLDAGSRAAGDGTRNYVMFDDKLIDILRRYGIAGTLGGGAAATAGTTE
jgi:hypothetical protein